MSNTQHTPGPWEVKELDDIFIRSEANRGICKIVDNGQYLPWAESQANAKLIAASPELLKTLETILEFCDVPINQEWLRSQCKSAIAKATGINQKSFIE